MSAAPPDSVPLAASLAIAARAWQRFREGASLPAALDSILSEPTRTQPHPRLRAAALDIATTAVRHLALAEAAVAALAARTPAPAVAALLAVALGQWFARRYPEHTLVDQAVACARSDVALAPAAGFVNALLRNALRRGDPWLEQLRRDDTVRWNAPPWWRANMRAAYADEWRAILAAANEPPPLVVRVNVARTSVADYLSSLQAQGLAARQVGPYAVWLSAPRPVDALPGFARGDISVQDAGSQLAAPWLAPAPGHRVLDACAAPGGKTAHLAELVAGGAAAQGASDGANYANKDVADSAAKNAANESANSSAATLHLRAGNDRESILIDAIEIDAARVPRINANLVRLGLAERVRVRCADAARTQDWHDGVSYDRILLDAPCTASGIVRRHPDIPWLRRATDVAQLATQQRRLLDALWPLVAPAGRLLYVVCSLFPEEGERQCADFLARQADARPCALPGLETARCRLLAVTDATPWEGRALPTVHDGYFFALFEKCP